MKSVIKEEWLLRYKSILFGVLILAAVNIATIIANGIAIANSGGRATLVSEILIVATIMLDTMGIFFWALIRGAGNMEPMLKKDISYMMKLIPKRSYEIIGGKVLVGLFEFIIYCAVVAFFTLILLAQANIMEDHALVISDSIVATSMNPQGFFANYIYLIKVIFTEVFWDCINFAAYVLIGFVLFQIFVNFISTIYYSFCRNAKFKVVLLVVFAMFVGWFTVRIATTFLDIAHITQFNEISSLWIPYGIFSVIGVGYFILTCYLYNRKVSL